MTLQEFDNLRRKYPGPLSSEEHKILLDLKHAIDFAIEHSMGIAMVVDVLQKDLDALAVSTSAEPNPPFVPGGWLHLRASDN